MRRARQMPHTCGARGLTLEGVFFFSLSKTAETNLGLEHIVALEEWLICNDREVFFMLLGLKDKIKCVS